MRLHGASANGSAAAPFSAPAAPTPIAPATMMPRPSSARRSSRPFPATSRIELRCCRDLLMRPPVCERSFHDARHVLQAQANETISIPDKADKEAYHSTEDAAYGLCVSPLLHLPHSRRAGVMPADNGCGLPNAAS